MSIEGETSPFSSRDSMEREIPARAASCAFDKPAASRQARTFFPTWQTRRLRVGGKPVFGVGRADTGTIGGEMVGKGEWAMRPHARRVAAD